MFIQNSNIAKYTALITLMLFSFQLFSNTLVKKSRVFMYLTYTKKNNGDKVLQVILKYKENKKFKFLENAKVQFFSGEEFDEDIGESSTNEKGVAIFVLPNDLVADSLGVFCFSAKFSGSDMLKKAKKSVCVKDCDIELVFNQKSEGRIIQIKAFEIKGEDKLPIDNELISVSVPTLFGDMILNKGELEEGRCELEFPSNLPGDSEGMLDIIAKITDSEVYGNVIRAVKVPWGIKLQHDEMLKSTEKGKLWTYNAPLWMVVTLAVLVLGVWSHFSYVIYKMYKINKEGKSLNKENSD